MPLVWKQSRDNGPRRLGLDSVAAIRARRERHAATRRFVQSFTRGLDHLEAMSRHTLAQDAAVQRFTTKELMVTAQGLLDQRLKFLEADKPIDLDLGYHYTRRENLDSIGLYGLMSKAERIANGIEVARENGESFGTGIYTAPNPYAFHKRYGDVCIIVARLPGHSVLHSKHAPNKGDSVLFHSGNETEMMILSHGSQCMPLAFFDASIINSNDPKHQGNTIVDLYHSELRNILNRDINRIETPLPQHLRILGCPTTLHTTLLSGKDQMVQYVAPLHIGWPSIMGYWIEHYSILPESLATEKCEECKGAFAVPDGGSLAVVQHVSCGRNYHLHCTTKHKTKCSCCHETLQYVQGKMPSGYMNITRSSHPTCEGHHHPTGHIAIEYIITTGVQKSYHAHCGVQHGKANHVAFLPDTSAGQDLLVRLVGAFERGLTFAVGTCPTSGQENAIVWSSIPHKTALSDGNQEDAFPDDGYIAACHKALNALCIPSAMRLKFDAERLAARYY
jgi:Deltex C-terminal domain